MNINEKLKYLSKNHAEIIKNQFDIFLAQVLIEDPDVTDVMFKADKEKITDVKKRTGGIIENIKNIPIPKIDDNFYVVTGFNKDSFSDIAYHLGNMQGSGRSKFLEGVYVRSQANNRFTVCRILSSSSHQKYELKDSAKEYINRLFETYHLSCQLEGILDKKEIKEKKLKI